MGFLDKAKDMAKGKKVQIKSGIDTAADKIDDKVPDHADKVQKAADSAKDAVDKNL